MDVYEILLYGHALGELSGLVDPAASADGYAVGEELTRTAHGTEHKPHSQM